MKVVAQKIWSEPAAFIGLLFTLGLLVLNLIGDDEWTAQVVVEILAPLISALGIRQAVSPAAGPREDEPPSGPGTTYQPIAPPPPAVNPATKLPGKTGFEELPPRDKE